MAEEREQPNEDAINTALPKKELAGENARLRARVRELEQIVNAPSSVSSRSADRKTEEDDLDDRVHRTRRRTTSESARFVRALVLSYIEGLQAAGEIISDFADDVLARNSGSSRGRETESTDERRRRLRGDTSRSRRGTEPRDDLTESEELARDLPKHIVSSYLDAADRATGVSERMVERFHDSYKETPN